VPYDDAIGLEAARSLQWRALETCLALNGRPYLAGSLCLTPPMRRCLYGAEYERFLALRSQMDPRGLFNRTDRL
jgi:FAD/FMN-containing dehydrogenase